MFRIADMECMKAIKEQENGDNRENHLRRRRVLLITEAVRRGYYIIDPQLTARKMLSELRAA